MKQKSSIMATLRPTHDRGPYEKMLSAFSSSRDFSSDTSQRSGLYSSASSPQTFLRR